MFVVIDVCLVSLPYLMCVLSLPYFMCGVYLPYLTCFKMKTLKRKMFYLLSEDLCINLLLYLDSFSLLTCSLINQSFYLLIQNNYLWKYHFIWGKNILELSSSSSSSSPSSPPSSSPSSSNSLTYSLFKEFRNNEINFLLNCQEISLKKKKIQEISLCNKYNKNNLNILIKLCENIELYYLYSTSTSTYSSHSSSLNDIIYFLNHLGLKSFHLFQNKRFYNIIRYYCGIFKHYYYNLLWNDFKTQLYSNSSLFSFYNHISSINMEGLIIISEIKRFGCDINSIDQFVSSIVERVWNRLGNIHNIQIISLPFTNSSFFPSVGWSYNLPQHQVNLDNISVKEFLHKRDIVSTIDKQQVRKIILNFYFYFFFNNKTINN